MKTFTTPLVSFTIVSETTSVCIVEFDTGTCRSVVAVSASASAEDIDRELSAQCDLAFRFRRLLTHDLRAGYPGTVQTDGVDALAWSQDKMKGVAIQTIANAARADTTLIEEIRRRVPADCELVLATTDVENGASLGGPGVTVFREENVDRLAAETRNYLLEVVPHVVTTLRPKFRFEKTAPRQ
jgi:hypothetical protein